MAGIRIVDLTDDATFGLAPPCADPTFDHRTCDYWEDADRGSKARRSAGALDADAGPARGTALRPSERSPAANPFAPQARSGPAFNPFLPRRPQRASLSADAPRKLALLTRGLAIFGSYAKVLLVDDEPCAYSQFGPLSAYPRALRLRDLYPQLPQSPLPAVITCIATTGLVRGMGLAARLVEDVCDDLARRGFSAVEAYPEIGAAPDTTSAANPPFWAAIGFRLVAPDERYPVFRRELA